jgi:hypothetical protein
VTSPNRPQPRVTRYEVCALPEDHIEYPTFAVTVEDRGRGRWAVCRGKRCLGVDGYWDWEPLPSSREDAWLEEHRFSLADALELAVGVAPKIRINGVTPADVLRGED